MQSAPQPPQNVIRVSHVTAPEPVEIHRGFSVTHPHPKHWHEEFHVCAITGGAGYIEHRGVSHFTPQGILIIVPPGEVHANNASNGGCTYENIYVPADLMARAAGNAAFPLLTAASDIYADFLQLVRALMIGTELHRESAVIAFFAALGQGVGNGKTAAHPSREPRAVRLVREYLDENFDREVGLAELAAITDLSPFHLNRAFRRQLGLPPHAYQVQLRISRAKALLRENWSIVDVASRTGFADQSHLTRHFKRAVGVTPGQFAGRPLGPHVKALQFEALQSKDPGIKISKNVQDQSAAAD